MFRLHSRASLLTAFCLLAASTAAAQGSFDQGSFGTDETAGAAQQSADAQAPDIPPPNSFDQGSFVDGATPQTPGSFDTGATPDPEPAGQIPGGSDFSSGSFDEEQTGVTPTLPEQVVVDPPADPEPQPPVTTQLPPNSDGPVIDPQITAIETRDFGVPPTQQLRNGQFHSQTPTSIPGGNLVTTQNLVNAMNDNIQMLVLDVLGGQYALPNAFSVREMAQGGSFNDHIQQQTVQFLSQVTNGQRDIPIVVYCSDPMCWLSYNAALRVIAAGYTNVYWYRGGIMAWQQAGLPLQPGSY